MKKTVRANHTEDETVVIEGGRNHSVDPLRLDAVLGDAASRSSVIVKFHSPGRTPFVQRVDQGDDAEVNKIVRLVRDSRVPVNRIEITEQVRGGVRRKPSLFERAVEQNPHPTRARKSAYDSQGDVAAALYEFRTQSRTLGDKKSSWARVVAARGRAEDEDLSAKAYGPLDADEIAAQRGQSSGLRALVKGNLPGASNKYEAFWRGKRITVEAPSSYAAQKIAADKLKAKKTHEVAIVLVELADGSPISIDPASL